MAQSSAPSSPFSAADRLFWWTFAGTAIVKLVLATTLPFTGDEAYFVVWGKNPDYGYYDHGAMTGWWLWCMLLFGQTPLLMRLPAIIASQAIGWLFWRTLRPVDHTKGTFAAVLYLISPLNAVNVLTTTDTPLLFFSVLSVLAAFQAVRRDAPGWWFLAGLALGFAFLSKYFAVLLGVAFAVLLLFFSGRPRVGALLILLLGVVPGVGINVAWNYEHSWVNVLFNLLTRHEASTFSLQTPLVYLAFIAVCLGPGLTWALLRRRTRADRVPWREAWARLRASHLHVFAVCAVVPLAVFLPVSFVKSIGLHWLLSFVPLVFPALVVCFEVDGLRRLLRPMLYYALFFVVLMLAIPLAPVEWARGHRSYFSIVLGLAPEAILEAVAPYRAEFRLTSPSYSKAAMLGFFVREHVPVIGGGSFHGRQDDLITDLRTFDGKDLMIVSDDLDDFAKTRNCFASAEIKELDARGAKVFVLLGRGFLYAEYRTRVLQTVADKFYRMPDWLERFAAPCFFCTRYDLRPMPPAE